MPLFKYKYICEECQEPTWFSSKERISSAGMRCSSCGCRWLVPSKASLANHNIGVFNDKKREYDATMEAKREGLK